MKRIMINFTVTQEELKKIDDQAEKLGMSRAAYIRYMCLYRKEENQKWQF